MSGNPAFSDIGTGACLHPPFIDFPGSTCNNGLYLAGDGNLNENSFGLNRNQEALFRQNVATAYLNNLVRPVLTVHVS